MLHPRNDDHISFNPMLPHILSHLDAKQVLRCMRISKQFYNTIQHNWVYMQKMAVDLEITPSGSKGRVASPSRWNGVLRIKCWRREYRREYLSYTFKLHYNTVSVHSYGNCDTVYNLFECRKKMGFRTNISLLHGSYEPRQNIGLKDAFSRLFRRLNSNQRHRTQSERTRESYTNLDGNFAVSNVKEGLSIVLNMIMSRCNVGTLTLGANAQRTPDDLLQAFAACVHQTRAKLISTATIYESSKTIFDILHRLGAKNVQIFPHDVIDSDFLRSLPIDQITILLRTNGIRFNSLTPIARLISEWQRGKRMIKHLEVFNTERIAPIRFEISSIQDLFNTLKEITITECDTNEIQAIIRRDCDSQILLVEYIMNEYNRYGHLKIKTK